MYNSKTVYAIVVAAGTSQRMGFNKLLHKINGKSVLSHSVAAIEKCDYIDKIVVVTGEALQAEVTQMLEFVKKPIEITVGGATRSDSVKCGLALTEKAEYIAIHDAARPFVTDTVIKNAIETAFIYGAAAPAVAVKDTIKQSRDGKKVFNTPDREKLWAVQTPQVFKREKYLSALWQIDDKQVTDDCMIFENAGYEVAFSQGDYANIKITTQEDLPKENGMPNIRIGHGYDVHKLVQGRKFILGGVEIPHITGLLGHSDADVLCHAISDSLLGALALGDIGKHFPDTDAAFKNADSIKLLEKVNSLILENGFTVCNIDATVLCQEPKLAPHIDEMRKNLSQALGIRIDKISVKATTEEKLGFTGNGEGVAAHCVCLLQNVKGLQNC